MQSPRPTFPAPLGSRRRRCSGGSDPAGAPPSGPVARLPHRELFHGLSSSDAHSLLPEILSQADLLGEVTGTASTDVIRG